MEIKYKDAEELINRLERKEGSGIPLTDLEQTARLYYRKYKDLFSHVKRVAISMNMGLDPRIRS